MAARRFRASWWVDFRWHGQRFRVRSPLNSKTGADAYEITLRTHLAEKGVLPDRSAREPERQPTVAEFAERWLRNYVEANNKVSEQKTKRYVLAKHVLPALGHVQLDAVRPEMIEQYKSSRLAAGLAKKTVNNHLTMLHTLFAIAEEWGVIREAPRVRFVRKLREAPIRYLRAAEADALIRATPAGIWRALVTTAVRTGLRFSELIALRWTDVDLDRATVCVQRANVRGTWDTPKSDRIRFVPLTSDVVAELGSLDRSGELVFALRGTWVRYQHALKKLGSFCAVAGVQRVGWHALRHSFASHLVAARAPLSAVQALLGHTSVKMTQRYVHIADDGLRDAVALLKIPPLQQLRATGGQRRAEPRPEQDAAEVQKVPLSAGISQEAPRGEGAS